MRCAVASLILAGALICRAGRAATFDEASGTLSLDQVFQLGFEADDAPELIAVDAQGERQSDATVAERFVAGEGALEGAQVFQIGGDIQWLAVGLDAAGELAGRRVEVRLWVQPRGTRPETMLAWYVGSRLLASLYLQPTGRGTDDGWRELSSGPVDFALGGQALPLLLVHDPHAGDDPLRGNNVAFDPELRGAIDAVEIADLGESAVPVAACSVVDEEQSCGPWGACLHGRCADGAAILGQVPLGAARAERYIGRRLFELESFEGIRRSQQALADIAPVVAALAEEEHPRAFWTALRDGWEALHDGHANPPDNRAAEPIGIGVCLGPGRADLSPEPGDAPLVYHTDGRHPIGSRLMPGDVLRRIDGLPVAEWMTHAERLLYYPGDPAAREAILSNGVLDAALGSGATLEFERCVPSSSGTPCTFQDVDTILIDLADEVGASLWAGTAGQELSTFPLCDFRFHRAIDGAGVGDHNFVDWADAGGIRTVQWNGFPFPFDPAFDAWEANMNEAFAAGPSALVLDERLGGGGPSEGWSIMFGHLLAEGEGPASHGVPNLVTEIDEALLDALEACSENGGGYDCGAYFPYSPPGEGAPRTCATSRVAVLTGQDVSGSDYFTRFMSVRAAPTRIFGIGPTYGGYGAYFGLSSLGLGGYGGSLQRHDAFFVTPGAAPDFAFESASGVWPDEIVLQRQSDAVADRDTMVEAAKAWLLSGG